MKKIYTAAAAFLVLGITAFGQSPTWEPAKPTQFDTILVELPAYSEGDVLHWGIVQDNKSWVRPIPAYRPEGSSLYGDAVRTPFQAVPGTANGLVVLGPFNNTNQVPGAVVFAISQADGQWDNNEGEDYLIPISRGRIVFSPEQPSANDVITVTVFNSDTNGFLRWGANATREIWTPIHPAYWPVGSEMSEDGVGLDTPLPDPDDAGRSIIELGPFDQGAQVVRSLHMAVHWDDEWDTDGGRNYNLDIQWRDPDDPQNITLLPLPEEHVTDDAIAAAVDVPSPLIRPVELWLNGARISSLSSPPYERSISLVNLPYGPYDLVARTVHEGIVRLDEATFWYVPDTATEEIPGDLEYGAIDQGDGTVRFALYAPGKKFISLVGNFNAWDPDAHRMNKGPDGAWWITLELEPGTYQYQYEINGDFLIGDPYAREVDWTNEEGEKGWKPADARSVLRIGEPPFEWAADDYTRPALEELVIYELYIHDMVPDEGFEGLIDQLDYIAELGFNAIEPLPWHPWPGLESWGYNPTFHFAPEQLYGTPNDLKRLIDEAHKRGLAVIIDMVLNHAEWNSPLYQLYGNDYEASPYFRDYDGHNWGFPKIDQPSPAVKRYVADIIRYWIEEYRIDGFRYDATRWTGWKGYNDWGASWFAYVARQADPDNIQIAEHLPIEPPLITDTEMDTGWHAEYRWRIREMITRAECYPDALAESLDGTLVGFDHSFQRIPYTESHDEERVVRELREAGFEEAEVFRRAALAIALPLTTPGVPMLYAGQEFGEYTKKTVGWNPLNWRLLDEEPNRKLLDLTRTLVHLRRTHPALRSEQVELLQADAESGLAVYKRSADEHHVLVAAQFGRAPVRTAVNLDPAAAWRDVLQDEPVEPGTLTVELLPGDMRIWATGD